MLGGLAGSFAAAFLRWLGDFWTGHVALWIALPPASGAALGWLLALALPGLRRLLVPSSVLTERVRRGDLGVKTCKGFYDWSHKSAADVLEARDAELLERAEKRRQRMVSK